MTQWTTSSEAAVLRAAWAHLASPRGYSRLGLVDVATEAGVPLEDVTRRWPSRARLVQDAVIWRFEELDLNVPNTGTIRDDLVEMLRNVDPRRHELASVLDFGLADFYEETGLTPSELRQLGGARARVALEMVFDRAARRGEIDLTNATLRSMTLAFALIRQDQLDTLEPPSQESLEEIVDMTLKLVAHGQQARRRPGVS